MAHQAQPFTTDGLEQHSGLLQRDVCAWRPGPLPDLIDPRQDADGTDSLRVDFLFHEQAFWLYLTGHRQGDLRRLAQAYHRSTELIYPSSAAPV